MEPSLLQRGTARIALEHALEGFHVSEDLLPAIEVRINTFTSLELIQSVSEAIRELRERFGISVTYEIVNESVLNTDILPLHATGEAIINVFGSIIEVGFMDDFDDIKRMIVQEVIRNIGRTRVPDYERIPLGVREHPGAFHAVIAG